nr:ThiF family adenylyltransferase [Streptomyces sp. TLI_235]
MWDELADHVLTGPGGGGAVVLAGTSTGPRGQRLLARQLILAQDGIDYVPGTIGHHALSASFVRDAIVRARDEGLAYLAVHGHLGRDRVRFSPVDLTSHERGYPALQQISGQVVGGLVLAENAAAGDLWIPGQGREPLAEVVVVGGNLRRLRPEPAAASAADPLYDRQARVFGDRGQESLRHLTVAVVGLGGVGSILVEGLARLGVGHLVLIDDDTVDETNLPRLLAAEPTDIRAPKTELAERNARRANANIKVTAIPERVEQPRALRALEKSDWIFLAADGDAARYWVNAVVHQHLLPATQVGIKIRVDDAGVVGQIHTATRLITPSAGCLWCNGLVDPARLAVDMLPAQQRAAADYVPEVPAPSVITLNMLAAAEGLNHFALAVAGLHDDPTDQDSVLHRPRSRSRHLQSPRRDATCRWCSVSGMLGRGRLTG